MAKTQSEDLNFIKVHSVKDLKDSEITLLNEEPEWLGATPKSTLSHIREIVKKLKAYSPGISVAHDRLHAINSALDHAAATGDDKGSIVASNDVTGAIEFIPKSTFTQVNADWNSVSGVSAILNKPTIPSAQVNSDWDATTGLAQILNKPTLGFGNLKSDGSVPMDYGLATLLSGRFPITSYHVVQKYVVVDGDQISIFTYGSIIEIVDYLGIKWYRTVVNSSVYNVSSTKITYEGELVINLFNNSNIAKIQEVPVGYTPITDQDIATKRYVDEHFFFTPAGEKSSAVDPGKFGESYLSDDYVFYCVKTGTAGNAIWKKTSLHQT
jgi:hypothetical protein